MIDLMIDWPIETSTLGEDMDWMIERREGKGWRSWITGESRYGNGRLRWLKNNDQEKPEECFN